MLRRNRREFFVFLLQIILEYGILKIQKKHLSNRMGGVRAFYRTGARIDTRKPSSDSMGMHGRSTNIKRIQSKETTYARRDNMELSSLQTAFV